MRRISTTIVAAASIFAAAALSGKAHAGWNGGYGVIYGYTPAYYRVLYGPPNYDRPIRSVSYGAGPYYSFRRVYLRRY